MNDLRYLQKSSKLGAASFIQSDYAFDDTLIEATENIIVEKRSHGARPKKEIFDRPILRSRAPKRGTYQAPWENQASVRVFPNGEFSFFLADFRSLIQQVIY